VGITGAPSTQQFGATAGKLNQCNSLQNTAITPDTQREGLLLSAHYQLAESMDLFTDITFSHEHLKATFGFLIQASGGSYGGTTLGAGNPYKPFGEDVGISFAYPGIHRTMMNRGSLIRPLIGVRGSVFSDWHYEVSAYLSRDRLEADFSELNASAFQNALNSSNPVTALNPFITSAPGATQLVGALTSPTHLLYRNQLFDGGGLLRGPLFSLPAGPLEAVIGSEYGNEKQFKGGQGNPARCSIFNAAPMRYSPKRRVPLLADREHPQQGSGSH